jgi:aminoglycoside phosphotransferase (APT) family kinase protein
MARAQLAIHGVSCEGIPSQAERLGWALERSEAALGPRLAALRETLAAMGGSRLCHGDYHPGNVIAEGGRYRAIDWMNAYSGDPASDAARTYLMFASPFLPEGTPPLIRAAAGPLKRAMAGAYLAEYLSASGTKRARVGAWLPVMAAARLHEHLPGEKDWLLGLAGADCGPA